MMLMLAATMASQATGHEPMHTVQRGRRPFGRCGEILGLASAGLVIAGTASFALAALMADFL
jgi:hypothetical protein